MLRCYDSLHILYQTSQLVSVVSVRQVCVLICHTPRKEYHNTFLLVNVVSVRQVCADVSHAAQGVLQEVPV